MSAAISMAVSTAPVALGRMGRTITSLTDAIKVQIWMEEGGNKGIHSDQQNNPDMKGPSVIHFVSRYEVTTL